jgi:photosystem II stability/assembly factor-like uncharacterized protein
VTPVFAVSTDWGKTWETLVELPSSAQKIYVDPASPKKNRTIYVVTQNSVSVLENGEWTHHSAPKGVERFIDVSAGFVNGGGAPVIYAVAAAEWKGKSIKGGVLVTRDGGRTWKESAGDLARQARPAAPGPVFRGVGACETNGLVAYIGWKNLLLGKGKKVHFGTAKTTDGGETWQVLVKETDPGKPAKNVKGAWLNELFGPIWGDAPRYLGVAPTDPDLCFTTDDGRTMRTTNGGKTWRACYSKRVKGGGWSTTGLDVTTAYGVHFDPFDKQHSFITFTDTGMIGSNDGGTSWTNAVSKGSPVAWRNTTYWMTFDPAVKGRCWSVMSANHDLPRPMMWRRGGVARYLGGVCISDDAGTTWRRSSKGMPETAATHILLDEKSPVDARVLYVTGFGTGVWKSVDGGRSWTLKNNGLPEKEPFAWRMTMDRDGALYLVMARRSENGSYGNDEDGALYKSTDGAESWKRIRLPRRVNGPNGLAVDPDDPRRMYLAAWCRETAKGPADGGIYLTNDGGRTWKCVHSKDQHVYDVTIDPKAPDVIYATGFESAAWRSANRGRTWKRIKGYNFKWGHRVVVDPYNRGMIYVTTFGGSVWYGPAEGDPKAKEDIVTPVVKYSR